MKNIGVFDSGLGGLIITTSLVKFMPEYNVVYLGDTKHLPYGTKSKEVVNDYSKVCIKNLVENFNCELVLIACNTASVATKNLFSNEFKTLYPNSYLISIVEPTIDYVISKKYKSVGLLATNGTVSSNMYENALKEKKDKIKVYSIPAPSLVNIIENKEDDLAESAIFNYVSGFKDTDIEAIILGCTHYPFYKDLIKSTAKNILKRDIDIISQDEFIAEYLKDFLNKNKDFDNTLSKDGIHKYFITELHPQYKTQAINITKNKDMNIELLNI